MTRKQRVTRRDATHAKVVLAAESRNAWLFGLTVLAAIAVCSLPLLLRTKSQRQLRQAEVALATGQLATAKRLADEVLAENPTSSQALLVASYVAVGQQRNDLAVGYLQRVPDDGSKNKVIALGTLGEHALQGGYASRAEEYLRLALKYDSSNIEANEKLISLLVVEGRVWEAQQLILPLLQRGHVSLNHLMIACWPEDWIADVSQFSATCLASVPEDPLPLLPEANEARGMNKTERAEELLRKIVVVHPGNLEAQSQLGRILVESSDPAKFLTWQESLPHSATEHPAIWFDYGVWAQRQGQSAAAARCYWEAVSRMPDHTAANNRLSQILVERGKPEQARPFAERGAILSMVQVSIDQMKSDISSDKIHQLIIMLESLGRHWEAAGWCDVLLKRDEDTAWASATLLRLSRNLDESASYTLGNHNPARQIDLSDFPLPVWQIEDAMDLEIEQLAGGVEFVNSAAAVGIDFTYRNGALADDREFLFETDGGGVAVLDFDNDGWPDLYFTQGGVLPPEAERSGDGDRLYRNLGDGRFADVPSLAGLGDDGYSQGVTVGDFDNDGFPDLYIANIGPNRLYHNNGDGTFDDVTSIAGVAGNSWTSSCLLADLDGDALPDLYVVNYLGGEELVTRACKKHLAGRCNPIDFAAEPDRLYLNLGDGRFEDVTEQCGINDTNGRGLGIVAADFDGSRRLSLFVANDESPNFLYVNQTATRGGPLAFSERGALSGVAYDTQGTPQACMGIAAGDANQDGLVDLFVTNFYHEANNLFVQIANGLFSEKCRAANLWDAGFEMLGWGTQFIDGDLDGLLDLIVANGHVHDPLDADTPYRMPPQYFQNQGQGRFAILPANNLGEYFQGKYLGRALARLDWNRDGLEDVCVTHLDTPAALLTNRTAKHGHFLALRLVGVASNRDALGASVRVTAGAQTRVRQLTAGDGFQASNQRQLVFGLGAAYAIDLVEVTWPSGLVQQFHDVPTDSQIMLVEGQVWEAIDPELKSCGTFPVP